MTTALGATSVYVFAAAELRLMVRSAQLVRAALADTRLFYTLERSLIAVAVQTAQEVQQQIPAIVRRAVQSAPQTAYARDVENSLTQALDSAARSIPQFSRAAYEAAFMEAEFRQMRGLTPRQATHHAWRRLMDEGISGFTDARGHQWNLASYAEMAVRTATARMYRYLDRQRILQQGVSLFLVSHDGRPCSKCAPWEGAVLAEWPGMGYPTVDEAMQAGLFHPNCLHVLTGFVPGRTKTTPPDPWTPEREEEYQATQQQRRLERALRAAKRQRDAAISGEDRAAARLRIAVFEKRLEILIQKYNLRRERRRESPDLGFH